MTINLNNTAVKAFLAISDRWDLTLEEQHTILGLPKEKYIKLKKKHLDKKTIVLEDKILKTIVDVLSIYKNIHMLLSPDRAPLWIRSPNKTFKEKTPLDLMLNGNVTHLVNYLNFYTH